MLPTPLRLAAVYQFSAQVMPRSQQITRGPARSGRTEKGETQSLRPAPSVAGLSVQDATDSEKEGIRVVGGKRTQSSHAF